MRVVELEPIPPRELLDCLRRTRLNGFDGVQPYADASLKIERHDASLLVPAQSYVLAPGVRRILELRAALAEHGVDLFTLDGGFWLNTDEAPSERIPVIPPIVECSREPDGREVMLINDGMHRVFAARSLGEQITVVAAYGVPPEYPYYAYALPGAWNDVVELEALPDVFEKKRYRLADNYKALFRNFNEVLPGLQQQRKRSNPVHLRA